MKKTKLNRTVRIHSFRFTKIPLPRQINICVSYSREGEKDLQYIVSNISWMKSGGAHVSTS